MIFLIEKSIYSGICEFILKPEDPVYSTLDEEDPNRQRFVLLTFDDDEFVELISK